MFDADPIEYPVSSGCWYPHRDATVLKTLSPCGSWRNSLPSVSQWENFSKLLSSISKKIRSSAPNCLLSIGGGGPTLHHACSFNWAGKRLCSSCVAIWCAASEVWVNTLLRHALLWSPPAGPPPPHLQQPCPCSLCLSGSKSTHMGQRERRTEGKTDRQTDGWRRGD